MFPGISDTYKTLFGRKKTPLELAEKILDKRIEYSEEQSNNFGFSFS